jgi:hypothetical protein
MALIKINGVDIPAPSEYTVGIQDISKAARNANGTMIIERVATKRKIDLGWKYLSRLELAQVLNAVSPVFFQVAYVDPQDNTVKTGTFYTGDRKCGMLDYLEGVPRYKDVSFSLIER